MQIINQKKYAKRESNIELLRIICMAMIIAHHCVIHGGAINMEYCSNKILAMWLVPGGKVGFTCFLAISTWFLVDAKFTTKRFAKIWLQVFFYSVVFAFISLCISGTLSIGNLIPSFLPIAGNSHGFAASYLLLYLLLPFLQKLTETLNKVKSRMLLMILFYAQILSQIIGYFIGYTQPFTSELLLFVFCYVLSFNLKRWPINVQGDKVTCGLIFVGIWVMLVEILLLQANGACGEILSMISALTCDESSLLYIVAGYALFFFFKNVTVNKNTVINFVASTTFGILLIHDHNYFRTILWNNILKCSSWYYDKYFFLHVIMFTIDIFIICGIIDYLRQIFIERQIMKLNKISTICTRMDDRIDG